MSRQTILFLVGCGCIAVTTAIGFALALPYRDRFLPGTVIDGQSVSGLTVTEAQKQLSTKPATPFTVYLRVDDIEVASSSSQLDAQRNVDQVLHDAFAKNNTLSTGEKLQRILHLPVKPREYSTQLFLDEAKSRELVQVLQQRVDIIGEDPSATLGVSNTPSSLKISPGKPGRAVKVEETLEKISQIHLAGNTEIVAPVASTTAVLNAAEIASASARAAKLVKKNVSLKVDTLSYTLNDKELIHLLAFPIGINQNRFNDVVNKLTAQINRPPKDAAFEYDEKTLKVATFEPSRNGLSANATQLQRLLSDSVRNLEETSEQQQTIQVPVVETEPQIPLSKTNTLGINERIGFGESEYDHSIPNRIHNVALTANRVNNYIVKAGEEFSFNKALGDVSAETGFKTAYVIRNGKTELGDGGGVCQVSTTLFRALLNAGLPITKRRPHSYRVSYYELNAKPGIDATVYAGDVDLRFKNDTGHAVLIHTQTDSKNLYMTVELYGTSDGRSAEIVDHKTYDFVPAPPDLYVDDPNLPAGKVQQIDFAASGIKASFKNIVRDKNGDVIREDTYFSNYKPWQAVFLRGTGV